MTREWNQTFRTKKVYNRICGLGENSWQGCQVVNRTFEDKNIKLIAERGICFEDIVVAVGDGGWLDTVDHPNQANYPGQKILIVEVNGYVFLVPYVEDDEKLFLKTIYASRKLTIKYIGRREK